MGRVRPWWVTRRAVRQPPSRGRARTERGTGPSVRGTDGPAGGAERHRAVAGRVTPVHTLTAACRGACGPGRGLPPGPGRGMRPRAWWRRAGVPRRRGSGGRGSRRPPGPAAGSPATDGSRASATVPARGGGVPASRAAQGVVGPRRSHRPARSPVRPPRAGAGTATVPAPEPRGPACRAVRRPVPRAASTVRPGAASSDTPMSTSRTEVAVEGGLVSVARTPQGCRAGPLPSSSPLRQCGY
jgi:hypothetical protein